MTRAAFAEREPLLKTAETPKKSASTSSGSTIDNGALTSQDSSAAGTGASTPISRKDADITTTAKVSLLTRLIGPPNTLKVLFAGLLISFNFSITQVSIFYAFHLMQCDVYYSSHPPYTGTGDRCTNNEIAAGTATQFSILAMSTTFCGTFNLFVTGWSVKRWGPRFALAIQTFFAAVRVAAQILGVVAGGEKGIIIFQCTQLVTILGGPAGYILVVNTIAGEIVEPARRTAVFGQLQGCTMLGQAVGFLLGGVVGEVFGIRMPFLVSFSLFLVSCLYALTVLPYISPESLTDGKSGGKKAGIGAFFAPLKVMAPQRIRLLGGAQVRKHWGVFFLSCGVFLGVLATGFVPMLLQMHATAFFDFNQTENGWLLSGNALVRSLFLFFMFPRIIDYGRKWWISRGDKDEGNDRSRNDVGHKGDANGRDLLAEAADPADQDVATAVQPAEEPLLPKQMDVKAADPGEVAGCRFDLFFLRWSLLLDGVLTAGAAWATQGWHIYLAAVLVPFGSGTAPAAKGVITNMCPHSQRADALNAITLVENVARLCTTGLFGFVFAALADIGRAELTFYVNAAIAVVGMAVLYLSHFPPEDSAMVVDLEDDEDTT